MKKWTCCLSVLALLLSSVQATAQSKEKKVEVTSPFEYVKGRDGKSTIKALPYLKRRPNWGVRLNFATSGIELKNETGGKQDGTPFQIDISINKNYGAFSIGPEIGYTSAEFENTASFDAFSFGLGVYLDGLSNTSYVVPFASVGGMSISSKNGDLPCVAEPDGSVPPECSLSDGGIAPYYRAGLLLGLNWIDKRTAFRALSDYGLQNSFLYFAVRKITPNKSEEGGFDLETKLYFEYGLQLEF